MPHHFQAAGYAPHLKPAVYSVGSFITSIYHGDRPGKNSVHSYNFCFVYGESLDYKAPLLKALEALNKAAVDVCNYFDKNVTKVTATLGWEQEYFVIDEGLHNARPDLVLCGRTVFGHRLLQKGQQLEDHLFWIYP
jgi:glutamine synthetase type III